MRQNVLVGARFPKWTNNNCESINHVLKQSIGWQPQQIPELIDTIKRLVDGQYHDADRAICGLGDYALRSTQARHRVTVGEWKTMTATQRQTKSEACFKLNRLVTSTDGTVTFSNTSSKGKKPGQIKRPQNVRSNIEKKRKLNE
jgi:hypothetical protein